ncbi:MAG: sulfatase-like hydrolase/transferase [Nitrospiraceae bacterium]|nr:sulfatase-like hydrolase/transferase [Nitrospiraceae bacterium]
MTALNRRQFLAGLGAAAAATALPLRASANTAASTRPNVIYIMADDLGWGDIGWHKGAVPTPHINAFFKNNVECTTFMACPVCSPTRAGLLTGRHPLRMNQAPRTDGELDPRETTVAEAFRGHGYATGCFGKWHNGYTPDCYTNPPGPGVNAHGFDRFVGFYGGGADYFKRTWRRDGRVSWHHDEKRTEEKGYTTDLIGKYACEFIRANKDRPFFCYVPFSAPHNPLQASQGYLDRVPADIPKGNKRIYAAMIIALDDQIGKILDEVDTQELRDNTIVVVTSDNGATPTGNNLPFRGGKHSVFEGGVHMPTAIRWPAGGLGASRTYDGFMGYLDMYPTLLAMAGLKPPAGRPLDGRNVWPAIRDGKATDVDAYYWLWGTYDCIRTPDWKLFRFYDHVELYDMHRDVCETKDVSEDHPAVAEKLASKLDGWMQRNGFAVSHAPKRLDAPAVAEPNGEVLEFKVTQTAPQGQRGFAITLATNPSFEWRDRIETGDWLEYDLLVAEDSKPGGFFVDVRGKAGGRDTFLGPRYTSVDQHGALQSEGPILKEAQGKWARRIIGLGNFCPAKMSLFEVSFVGTKPGHYHFYLDNVIVRKASGKHILVWRSGADTELDVPKSSAFTGISVKAIPLGEIKGASQ